MTKTDKIFALQAGHTLTGRESLQLNVDGEKLDQVNTNELVYEIKLLKREFLVELFKVYNQLPFLDSMRNFS